MANAIEIRNLRKQYRDFQLKDVSFTLPEGHIMGLIGPNGAGKTTIIKLIMNLIRKESGSVEVFGMDHVQHEAEVKSRIGFVYDVPAFYLDVSLKNIAKTIAPFYRRWDGKLFEKTTQEFDLPMKKKFKKLSQGMKTKFALALALSHDADLILMDEPTSGLDPVFRRELLERLSEILQDEKKAVLFSTHITTDLEKRADYITCIQDGEIIFSTSRDELFSNWGVVKGGDDLLSDEAGSIFRAVEKRSYGVEGLTSNLEGARALFSPDTVVERASLEEIMVFLSGREHHVN